MRKPPAVVSGENLYLLLSSLAPTISPFDSIMIQECSTQSDENMHSDADLDHWGKMFVDNNLQARGLVFATFMESPAEIFMAIIYKKAPPLFEDDFYPLLKKQRHVERLLHTVNVHHLQMEVLQSC